MVDASENSNCADVAADAISYYSYKFESCQDYKCVVPLRKEVVIIDADLLNGELSTRAMFIYN